MDKQTKTLTWDTTTTYTATTTDVTYSVGTVLRSEVRPTVATTVISYGVVMMPVLYVTAKSGDFGSVTSEGTAETNTVSSGSESSSESSSSTSVAPTGSATGTPERHAGGGLSAGAKAGIGVGVGAVVVLACLGALLLWRRKRKGTAGEGVEGSSAWTKPELGGGEKEKPELAAWHGDGAHELPGEERPRELP